MTSESAVQLWVACGLVCLAIGKWQAGKDVCASGKELGLMIGCYLALWPLALVVLASLRMMDGLDGLVPRTEEGD